MRKLFAPLAGLLIVLTAGCGSQPEVGQNDSMEKMLQDASKDPGKQSAWKPKGAPGQRADEKTPPSPAGPGP